MDKSKIIKKLTFTGKFCMVLPFLKLKIDRM